MAVPIISEANACPLKASGSLHPTPSPDGALQDISTH